MMKKIWKRPLLPLLLLLLLPFNLYLLADSKTEMVDRLFQPWNRKGSPGCALALIQDGKIVYKRGYGQANLELNVPITPRSVFYLGSCSKQFTAMSVALLAREGKISLDDDIRKYIPEIPDYGQLISIRHLIHHTSGFRDYLTLLEIAGVPFGNYHEEDVLELIGRQKELNFRPGEKYLYSNSGYFLLAVIVKRASGKSLREYANEKIFNPLGMKNTRFHDDFKELIPNRASGYFPGPGGCFLNFISTFDCVGSGGLYSTVEDLSLWDLNFEQAKIGGPELIRQIQSPGTLTNGEVLDYAFGLIVGTYRGLKTVSHGGALGGYRAMMARFPEQNFSVICLANLSTSSLGQLGWKIADIYLENYFCKEEGKEDKAKEESSKPPAPDLPKPPSLTAEELRAYTGEYWSEELGVSFFVSLEEGKLTLIRKNAAALPLLIRRPDHFAAGPWSLDFIRDASGKISGFALDAARVKNLKFGDKYY